MEKDTIEILKHKIQFDDHRLEAGAAQHLVSYDRPLSENIGGPRPIANAGLQQLSLFLQHLAASYIPHMETTTTDDGGDHNGSSILPYLPSNLRRAERLLRIALEIDQIPERKTLTQEKIKMLKNAQDRNQNFVSKNFETKNNSRLDMSRPAPIDTKLAEVRRL